MTQPEVTSWSCILKRQHIQKLHPEAASWRDDTSRSYIMTLDVGNTASWHKTMDRICGRWVTFKDRCVATLQQFKYIFKCKSYLNSYLKLHLKIVQVQFQVHFQVHNTISSTFSSAYSDLHLKTYLKMYLIRVQVQFQVWIQVWIALEYVLESNLFFHGLCWCPLTFLSLIYVHHLQILIFPNLCHIANCWHAMCTSRGLSKS